MMTDLTRLQSLEEMRYQPKNPKDISKSLIPVVGIDNQQPAIARIYDNKSTTSSKIEVANKLIDEQNLSPYILKYLDYDMISSNDEHIFIIEDVILPSLGDILRSTGEVLDCHDASIIICQILKGISHAYSIGLVHRQLSLDSIYLRKQSNSSSSRFSVVIDGLRLQKPQEQTGGNAILCEKEEVFSIGCMFFEMIIGDHPFGHKKLHDLRHSTPITTFSPRSCLTQEVNLFLSTILTIHNSKRPTCSETLALPFLSTLVSNGRCDEGIPSSVVGNLLVRIREVEMEASLQRSAALTGSSVRIRTPQTKPKSVVKKPVVETPKPETVEATQNKLREAKNEKMESRVVFSLQQFEEEAKQEEQRKLLEEAKKQLLEEEKARQLEAKEGLKKEEHEKKERRRGKGKQNEKLEEDDDDEINEGKGKRSDKKSRHLSQKGSERKRDRKNQNDTTEESDVEPEKKKHGKTPQKDTKGSSRKGHRKNDESSSSETHSSSSDTQSEKRTPSKQKKAMKSRKEDGKKQNRSKRSNKEDISDSDTDGVGDGKNRKDKREKTQKHTKSPSKSKKQTGKQHKSTNRFNLSSDSDDDGHLSESDPSHEKSDQTPKKTRKRGRTSSNETESTDKRHRRKNTRRRRAASSSDSRNGFDISSESWDESSLNVSGQWGENEYSGSAKGSRNLYKENTFLTEHRHYSSLPVDTLTEFPAIIPPSLHKNKLLVLSNPLFGSIFQLELSVDNFDGSCGIGIVELDSSGNPLDLMLGENKHSCRFDLFNGSCKHNGVITKGNEAADENARIVIELCLNEEPTTLRLSIAGRTQQIYFEKVPDQVAFAIRVSSKTATVRILSMAGVNCDRMWFLRGQPLEWGS
ncbi:hypothetical protein BLNAU_17702 [Blattamonas nauphoetae]|uniref:non-specific serine/threonine protein kinase n=1 Tax=Blattamonas nauphoetae TaxID=2049346 RepID=A0ABQ9X9L2_9EUKA|nr:hypothetical protein BLNAU_17702 [Blattamonas nauphoetae]